jgi:formylglycine-generating enzyme required for sulfatase activity/serine/threonine protein kinase
MPAPNLAPDQRVGEYVLVEKIADGTFGSVWRARHHAWTDQVVAVKVPTDPDYIRNLQHEGHVVHGLVHEGIVRAIAFDPYATVPYLVMEYIPGSSLRALIRDGDGLGGPMKPADAAAVLRQVLAALAYAHGQGVVHRDLKPENILINDQRARREGLAAAGTVKVTDFGLGKAAGKAAAAAGSIAYSASLAGDDRRIVGTLEYMSPEQRHSGGDVNFRSDLYAVGLIGCEMLSGTRPGALGVAKTLARAGVHEAWAAFLEKALEEEPERRYAGAAEMMAALAGVERQTATRQAVPPPTPRVMPPPSPGPAQRPPLIPPTPAPALPVHWLLVGAVVGGLALLIVGWIALMPRPPQPPQATISSNSASPSGGVARDAATDTRMAIGDRPRTDPADAQGHKPDAGSHAADADDRAPAASVPSDPRLARLFIEQRDIARRLKTANSSRDQFREASSITLPANSPLIRAAAQHPSVQARIASDKELAACRAEVASVQEQYDQLLAQLGPDHLRVQQTQKALDRAKERCASLESEVRHRALDDARIQYENDVAGLERSQKASVAATRYVRTLLAAGAAPPFPGEVGKTWENPLGMTFAYIPAGKFTMGPVSLAERGQEQHGNVVVGFNPSDDVPHPVRLSRAFLLGTTAVTEAQWESLMGTPSGFEFKGADLPVEDITWDQAVAFCRRLSELEGRRYRLPTEAEWEYACRAGSATVYYFGDDEKALDRYAWVDGKRHAVAMRKPNAWGLYDMAGNVQQWCGDWYAKYSEASAEVVDPTGPAQGTRRAIRGGGCKISFPRECASSYRASLDPSNVAQRACGFRCLLEIPNE